MADGVKITINPATRRGQLSMPLARIRPKDDGTLALPQDGDVITLAGVGESYRVQLYNVALDPTHAPPWIEAAFDLLERRTTLASLARQ